MIINSKEKIYKRILSGVSCVLCFLFLFVCLSFNFPLNLLKTNEQENKNQSSVNDIIMFAVASEDTGASSAPSSEKGGCHYLGAGTKMTMSEGTITGTSKKYGGAVYISSGATFTMSGGTISGCTARYGGAIYVASGGTLNMTGGTIEECGATYAPAIYVEENATVTINGEIIDCFYGRYYEILIEELISTDTIMIGNLSSGKAFHYLDYGTYPQTYVGDTMNTTLENWYSSNSPTAQTTYEIRTRTWTSYLYTDGNYYARGSSYPQSSSYTYANGTAVKTSGTITWFKVEPIRWIVLNYDEVQEKTATTIDCLSELALTADIPFDLEGTDNSWVNSDIRAWLNSNFINQAFTSSEKEKIATKTVFNNVTGDYSSSTSDGTGTTTQDKIYLLSYYEVNSVYFTAQAQRLCSPTDFALCNYAHKYTSTSCPTTLYPSGGTTYWWLRSAGDGGAFTIYVNNNGNFINRYTINETRCPIRPAISFKI